MHTLADILEQYKNPVHPAMPMTTQEAKTAIYNLLASEAETFLDFADDEGEREHVEAVPLDKIAELMGVKE